jgi:hypothetical protein
LRLERNGVEYYNSGSWTQPSATYITIDREGARIAEYAAEEGCQQREAPEFDFEDLAMR